MKDVNSTSKNLCLTPTLSTSTHLIIFLLLLEMHVSETVNNMKYTMLCQIFAFQIHIGATKMLKDLKTGVLHKLQQQSCSES